MKDRTTNTSEDYASDTTILEPTLQSQPDAMEILQHILHMLAVELPKLNMSQDTFQSIHDGFITKPHLRNASLSDFSLILTPLVSHLRRFTNASEHSEKNDSLADIEPNQLLDTNTHMCLSSKLDSQQLEHIQTASFWMEGIFRFLIGAFGIISNLVAIPILCRPKMKSIFNYLLIFLLIFNTIYIAVTFFTGIIWPEWKDSHSKMTKGWFCLLFSIVLYPLQQFATYSSTFITMLMARQRYMAIRHPIEYRNSTIGVNLCLCAMKNLLVVLLVSGLITFPVYFEMSVTYHEVPSIRNINETHLQYVLEETASLALQPIRINLHYILWYRNVLIFTISLLIPIISLSYWNSNIVIEMKRHRRRKNNPPIPLDANDIEMSEGFLSTGWEFHRAGNINNPSRPVNEAGDPLVPSADDNLLVAIQENKAEQVRREETRKAMVLFGIVISFTLCNVPRIILNIEELGAMVLSYYKLLKIEDDDPNRQVLKPCFQANFWAHILKIISKLLLTLNASSCCFVYCVMCPVFREEISLQFKSIFNSISNCSCCRK